MAITIQRRNTRARFLSATAALAIVCAPSLAAQADEPVTQGAAPTEEAEPSEAAEPASQTAESDPGTAPVQPEEVPAAQPEPTHDNQVSDTTDEVEADTDSVEQVEPAKAAPAKADEPAITVDTPASAPLQPEVAAVDEPAPKADETATAEEESDPDSDTDPSSTIDIPSEEFGYTVNYEVGDDPVIVFLWKTSYDTTGWMFKITKWTPDGLIELHDEQVPKGGVPGRYSVPPGSYYYERYHQDAPEETASGYVITLWVTPKVPIANEEEQTIVIPDDKYFDYYLSSDGQTEPISAGSHPVEPGDVTITAEPRPDVPVRDYTVVEWTFTINEPADPEPEPEVINPDSEWVHHTQNPGKDDDQVTVLDEYKDQVKIDGKPKYEDGNVTFVLVPKEGYTFPDGAESVEIELTEHVEDVSTPGPILLNPELEWVTHTPIPGDNNDQVSVLDEYKDQVKIDGKPKYEGGNVTVVLVPTEGHAFPDGKPVKVSFPEYVGDDSASEPKTITPDKTWLEHIKKPGQGDDDFKVRDEYADKVLIADVDPDFAGPGKINVVLVPLEGYIISDGDEVISFIDYVKPAAPDPGTNPGDGDVDSGNGDVTNPGGGNDTGDGDGSNPDDGGTGDGDTTDGSDGSNNDITPGDDTNSTNGDDDADSSNGSDDSDSKGGSKGDTVKDKSSGSDLDKGEKQDTVKESAQLNAAADADTGVDETPVLAPVAGAALFITAGIVTFLIRRRSQQ